MTDETTVDLAFEWLDDSNAWIAYDEDLQKELVGAAVNGKSSSKIKLPTGRNNYAEVNFDSMVQKNVKTKWERVIRCCIHDSSDSSWNSWEWENESKFFGPYPVKTCIALEQQFLKDKKQKVSIKEGAYECDLDNMVQTNVKSGFSRNMRRIATTNQHTAVEVEKSVKMEVDENGDLSQSNGHATKTEPSASSKSGKSGRKRKTEDHEEDSTSGESRSKSGKSTGGTLSSGTKKLTFSNKAPVDDECVQKKDTCHVFVDSDGTIWDAMLNQTNVGNNNNKYYLLQLLEDNSAKAYHVWFRWGRVGYKGQNSLQSFGADLNSAKSTFEKKFKDKTVNDWHDRGNFEKCPGKYDLVAIDYGNSPKKEKPDEVKKEEADGEETPVPDSQLDEKVFQLMKTICNIQSMENTVKELEYDLSKAPLGKLTTAQIKAGYQALNEISKLIDKKVTSGAKLAEACSRFYTRIPHAFGFKVPPLISTHEKVKEKLDLLDALSEIEIAMKIIKSETAVDKHPVDQQYEALKCDIRPLPKGDARFDLIEKYLQGTHAKTHNLYTMSVENIFCLSKLNEKERFKDVGNRRLLWHGSRLSNMVGILSHGLKIAPPEAPVTGYMFGKGVYFADMSSKSANYCFPQANQTGFLLLCDVALGKCNELIDADYNANKLPSGCHSVFGIGREEPDPSASISIDETGSHADSGPIKVPCGKPKERKKEQRTSLNYNEYIIYDVSQIQLKYLVQVKFNFDSFI